MARQTSSQEASASRPKRTPVAARNRLNVRNKEAGYVYRIVNDIDDRVELLKERGWEVVPDAKVGAVGNRRVDNASAMGSSSHISVGAGVKAVVMRISEEWYKEDQSVKQAEIDALEATMRSDAKKNADYGSLTINDK